MISITLFLAAIANIYLAIRALTKDLKVWQRLRRKHESRMK